MTKSLNMRTETPNMWTETPNTHAHARTLRHHAHGAWNNISCGTDQTARETRHVGACITGNERGLRPSTRDDLTRLSRLGVRPDHLWEEAFVCRMAWIAFQADHEWTAWLLPNGEVAELRLGERGWTDLSDPPTHWCIHAGFGERRTLPEQERLLLLHGKLERAVSVGVGMGLPGTICMGWRSPAGTGGVILYGPIQKGQAG